MADNTQDNLEGSTQDQGAEAEGTGVEGQAAEGLLTQEQFDAALQERLNEVKNQSAAEVRSYREQAEATIRGYQQALQSVQAGRPAVEDDDPAPANMTQDQQIMWNAGKPQRQYFKNQMRELQSQLSQAVGPAVQDATVSAFFRGKPGIPDAVKADTAAMFAEASSDPNVTASPTQIIQASYVRALAKVAEAQYMGGAVGAVQGVRTQGVAKPQPRIVAPNGSADLGGTTRPVGVGRVGRQDMSWRDIQEQLKNSGKFPEDLL